MVRLPDTGEIIETINVVKDGEKWKAVLAGPVNQGIFVPAKQYTGQHNTLSAFDILPNNKVVHIGFY